MGTAKEAIDVSQLAGLSLAGTHEGLSVRLREVTATWDTGNIRAQGNFYYLAFKDGKPSGDEFLDFVYHSTIPFCLPRAYVQSCLKQLADTRNTRFFFEAVDRAKELFIRAKKKCKRSGEPGEVILFTLLEGFLKAPRVVCKMSLKTNSNMEVHGSDAIHIKYISEEDMLVLLWGEAKLYAQLQPALTQICESVKGFLERDEHGNSIRKRDIFLIQEHPDVDTESTREAIASFFDPYSEHSNKVREIHACLAVWDSDIYSALQTTPPEKVEAVFQERYREHVISACSAFLDKAREHGLESLRFHLFLLPLDNVAEFRKRFFQKLGVTDYD